MTFPASEWARCRHWIEAALTHSPGFETIEDIEEAIASGAYQFWPFPHCAAITEIGIYPRKKVLAILHGGGDLNELLNLLEPVLCECARLNGCDLIMGLGRKGWERPSEKHGYRFGWLAMIKNLKS